MVTSTCYTLTWNPSSFSLSSQHKYSLCIIYISLHTYIEFAFEIRNILEHKYIFSQVLGTIKLLI
jgi:hypothetical protein